MPVTAQEQEIRLETMRIGAFSGGMNTSAPANRIADEEAVQIENMEYDEKDTLVTRNGVTSTATVHTSRITSILDFEGATSFVGILYTVDIRLISSTLSGVITNITGSLVLPDGVRWYWRIFNGVAVGVNGLASGHNPIQVVAPAPGTASHLTTAPPGKFIEVWNNRLWIARSDQPNQLQASDIGSHTSWNTDAGANPSHGALWDIDKDDGDIITGLYATKERLFIFKRKSIYVAFPTKEPATDLRNIKIDRYASNVGCIAATTIRPVLDDVLFLSEGGIASLSASQVVADFESAIVSLKISDIQKIRRDLSDEDVFSFVISDKSQYWLCVASNVSNTSKNITYVFDYRQIKAGILRWFEFTGLAFGTSIEAFDHDVDDVIYLLGCHNTVSNGFFIGKYIPNANSKTFIDSTLAIRQFVLTKVYDFGADELRKYLIRWFNKLSIITGNVSLSVSYFLDESDSPTGTYTFNLSVNLGGALFDNPLVKFDSGFLFDLGADTIVELIRRSFLYGKSRKARTVQFSFLCNQVNQGFGILGFGIKYQNLSEFKSQTI